MKQIRESVVKGKRRVTVELDEGEKLMSVRDDAFYKLNYPMDDQIVQGWHLQEPRQVSWCVIEQRWTE